jgi:hypothetical protein
MQSCGSQLPRLPYRERTAADLASFPYELPIECSPLNVLVLSRLSVGHYHLDAHTMDCVITTG